MSNLTSVRITWPTEKGWESEDCASVVAAAERVKAVRASEPGAYVSAMDSGLGHRIMLLHL